jgi:type III secretory pathway component EscT
VLAGARMTPIAWVAPPLGDRARLARLLVAALATALVAPLLLAAPPPQTLAGALVVELLAGLTLGLLLAVPFRAAEAAGALYDHALRPWRWLHAGRGILSQAYRLLALALFAALGGPSLAVRAMARSYLTLPVGRALPPTPELLLALGAQLVVIAATLAAPGLAALLLADLAGALIIRAQPALARASELYSVRALVLLTAAAAALLVTARALAPALTDAARLRLP